MHGDLYFFDIPVYRCAVDKHTKEMEIEKRNLVKIFEDSDFTQEGIRLSYSNLENHFDRNLWYSWRFNEIIGWIRLFVCGTQLRGELWWVSSKRIIKRGKKEFRWYGKAFESQRIERENSNKIFEILYRCLNQLINERPCKGRYIDLDLFLTLGPYINWRKLIDNAIISPQEKE